MSTLIQLSIADRIAFTTYVTGDQKDVLLSQFNPREREIFTGMAANIGSSTRSSTSSLRPRCSAPSSPSANFRR